MKERKILGCVCLVAVLVTGCGKEMKITYEKEKVTVTGESQTNSELPTNSDNTSNTKPNINTNAPLIGSKESEIFEKCYSKYEVAKYEYNQQGTLDYIVVEAYKINDVDYGMPLFEKCYFKTPDALKYNEYYIREQYDNFGNLLVRVELDDSRRIMELVEYEYTYSSEVNYKMGQLYRPEYMECKGKITTYDDKGEVIQEISTREDYEYDEIGNVTVKRVTDLTNGGKINVYEYKYDDACNLIMSKSEGEECIMTYDINRLLTSEAKTDGSYSSLTLYEYDDNGNITHKKEYYAKDELEKYDNPDSYNSDQLISDSTYICETDHNERVTICYKNGMAERVMEYYYTTTEPILIINRPIKKDVVRKKVTYSNNEMPNGVGSGVSVESYNERGDIICKENYRSLEFYKIGYCSSWSEYSYEYDVAGNLVSYKEESYTRSESAKEKACLNIYTNKLELYTYDESGKLLTKENGINNEKHIYTYDQTGKLLSDEIVDLDQKHHKDTYTYDSQGNLLVKEELYYNTEKKDYELDIKRTYTYNKNGQLICEEEKHTYDSPNNGIYSDMNGTYTINYDYDQKGNLIKKWDFRTLYVYEYDENNRIVTQKTYRAKGEEVDDRWISNVKDCSSVEAFGGEYTMDVRNYEYDENSNVISDVYQKSDRDTETIYYTYID